MATRHRSFHATVLDENKLQNYNCGMMGVGTEKCLDRVIF